MRTWWRSITAKPAAVAGAVEEVRRIERSLAKLDAAQLRAAAKDAATIPQVVAVTTLLASRILGFGLFDVQLHAAIALTDGKIVEMQTGEGKTVAAVPAIAWFARAGHGVHVFTANDYLARRDARWMGGIYERLGLSVGVIQQHMTAAERRAAYRCDVTYGTANEVGFDYLRDQLALSPEEQVLRPFAVALCDEVDSALIDEARIPLVIAGGEADANGLAGKADLAVRRLQPWDRSIDDGARNVALTPSGLAAVERTLGCDLYAVGSAPMMAAVHEALHAHTLLHRDIDYVVHAGQVLSVDEFKGRIVHERRWPGGLQTALEWKEGVPAKAQGRVLGSITIENLIALFPTVCGMSGTAATQARDFREMYDLEVEVVPTHRPMIRVDHPDALFGTTAAKEAAVIEEIRAIHASGRPVLVGTSSVRESESISRRLHGITHSVLNARNEEAEAAIVARAGEPGAVTISTNMAGRGVDIKLGPGVADLGGLHVIGTSRHESRRIDHQLRGRAGRQGDPGSSRFFVSKEDALMVKFGSDCASADQAQRIAEGQNLGIRVLLRKYETIIEAQRLQLGARRNRVLTGAEPAASDLERQVLLETIDDLWADYLNAVSDLRADAVWISLGAASPFAKYIVQIHAMYQEFLRTIEAEHRVRMAQAIGSDTGPRQRGATWTYLTTDEPFGHLTERILRGLKRIYGFN
jgi:preprotein translocase subunit SecA